MGRNSSKWAPYLPICVFPTNCKEKKNPQDLSIHALLFNLGASGHWRCHRYWEGDTGNRETAGAWKMQEWPLKETNDFLLWVRRQKGSDNWLGWKKDHWVQLLPLLCQPAPAPCPQMPHPSAFSIPPGLETHQWPGQPFQWGNCP